MKLLALAIFLGLVFVGYTIVLAAMIRHRGFEESEVLPFLFHLVIAAGIFGAIIVLWELPD